ncbi:MAG: YkvA family protein [Bauldia litoralis]
MNEVLYGEILGPEDDDRREKRVRSKFWGTVRKAARAIPFLDEVVAAYYCALDPATPPRVKGTILAALAYFVLPIDAVPDLLVGVGFTDDITVLLAALSIVRAHITPAHRKAASDALADEEPSWPGER